VVEDCFLLAYDAASLVTGCHVFIKHNVFIEMLGTNYLATQCHVPEEQMPHVYVSN